MGVADEADHRSAHRRDSGREREVAEHPLQAGAGSGLGWRYPAKSKYVHQAPKPTTMATSPTSRVSPLTGSPDKPATTSVRVSPSTMMVNAANRSMSAPVIICEAVGAGLARMITAANPAR
jgi:hypothetical protein